MKLLILVVAITWSSAAKLDNTYLPPRSAQDAGGSGNFLQSPFSGSSGFQSQNALARNGDAFPQQANEFSQHGNDFNQGINDQYNNADGFNSFEGRPERAQAAYKRNAAILRQDNQNDGETYAYAYETENGIIAEENGVATNGVEAQGGFSYTGDDGQVYSIRYTADQNGFMPQGDHLPTPPPIPEEILKALEQNARDEAAGIYDDGSYNEAKYGSGDEYKSNTNNNYNNNAYNNQNEYNGADDSVVTNSAVFRNGPASNQGFNGPNQGRFNNAANQRGFNTEARLGGADTNKAYLPPFQSSRQQPSNARSGYRY